MDGVKDAKTIRLTIDSKLENVFLVGLAVKTICLYQLRSEEEAYQLELCVVEAVNNAIKHGYNNESGHEVDVIVSLHLDRITFQICDSGKRMETIEAAKMDFDPQDLETLPERGMGLYIIQTVMDDMTYETFDAKNILTMSKYFGDMKSSTP